MPVVQADSCFSDKNIVACRLKLNNYQYNGFFIDESIMKKPFRIKFEQSGQGAAQINQASRGSE
ncbi:hypothetical protein [Pantoea sp.]|nr:hypothetical protein [Pantoea sp.]